jgi:hypothetical protein
MECLLIQMKRNYFIGIPTLVVAASSLIVALLAYIDRKSKRNKSNPQLQVLDHR